MATSQNAITVVAAIAAVVIPYLLTQTDVAVPPILKVLLTAANLALVVVSRLSNPNSTPVQVQVTGSSDAEPVKVADATPPTP